MADRGLVDIDDLVHEPQPPDLVVGTRVYLGAVQGGGEHGIQDIVDEGALPRPGHARDADEETEGQGHVDVLQVVLARPEDAKPVAARLAAVRGHFDPKPVAEVSAGQRGLEFLECGGRAFAHDAPSERAGPRAEIHQVVGMLQRVAVVFDHDQGIAEIAQVLQGLDQPEIVPRVKPDRGFVQHVEHAGQSRSDLAGQPDPLRLAARKRGRPAVEGQVIQSHVQKEAHAVPDFRHHLAHDLPLRCREVQSFHEVHGAVGGHGAERRDGHAVDQHGEAFGPEPAAPAGRTGRRLQQAGEFGEAVRVPGGQFHGREDAPELEGQAGDPAVVYPPVAAIEQHLELFRRQRVDGRLQGKTMGRRHLFEQVEHGPFAHRAFPPDRRRGVANGFRPVRYQQVEVDPGLGSESLAFGAHARPVVEGEALGGRFFVACAAGRARIVAAEADIAGAVGTRLLRLGDQQAPGQLQGRLDRVGQALPHVPPHDDAVHHYAQFMAAAAVDPDVLFEAPQDAVDAHPDEPVPASPVQEDFISLGAFRFEGGEERGAGPLRQGHDAVHDLAGRLRADGDAAGGTVGHAGQGVERAQILVDLRNRAHRGTGVPAR